MVWLLNEHNGTQHYSSGNMMVIQTTIPSPDNLDFIVVEWYMIGD